MKKKSLKSELQLKQAQAVYDLQRQATRPNLLAQAVRRAVREYEMELRAKSTSERRQLNAGKN